MIRSWIRTLLQFWLLHAHAGGRCPHARPRTVLTVQGLLGDSRLGIALQCSVLHFSFPGTLTEIGGIYDAYYLSSSLNQDKCLKVLYLRTSHPTKNGHYHQEVNGRA